MWRWWWELDDSKCHFYVKKTLSTVTVILGGFSRSSVHSETPDHLVKSNFIINILSYKINTNRVSWQPLCYGIVYIDILTDPSQEKLERTTSEIYCHTDPHLAKSQFTTYILRHQALFKHLYPGGLLVKVFEENSTVLVWTEAETEENLQIQLAKCEYTEITVIATLNKILIYAYAWIYS